MTEHQEFGQCSRMPVILSQRILEPPFFIKQNSRPFRTVFASENPSIHIFRLYHKDSEGGDNDMINLRRSIRRWDDDVFKSCVQISVQRTRK